jgi:hypothetical protein
VSSAAPPKVPGDGAERPVQEDADGALGPTQDLGDLGGRELMDEPEHDRLAPVAIEAGDRLPRGTGVVPGDDGGLWLIGRRHGHRRRRLEGGDGMSTEAPPPLRHDVAGDPEQPQPEGRGALAVLGPGPFLEPRQAGKGGQERPLGGVLRLVMVAQLVDRVVVLPNAGLATALHPRP